MNDYDGEQVCSITAQVNPGEGVCSDWRGRRTNRFVTLPPPPGRRIPRHNCNTWEGRGGRPGGLKGHGYRAGAPPPPPIML